MTAEEARTEVEALYASESRYVLATLLRLFGGDFELAEEALHEAFTAALQQWQTSGPPRFVRSWLVSAGRFKALDALRKRARHDAAVERLALALEQTAPPPEVSDEALEDDRLRLIFTCCHPALVEEAQVALTLREVCGLTTEEIARAFLVQPPTLAQRIVRAKARLREARVPYQVPEPEALPARLDAVLRVIYLVHNEGYAASAGSTLTRAGLSAEAIRLARLLVELLPEPEALGLLGLMLLQHARAPARSTAEGEVVLIADQDRTLWDRALIHEGSALVERALRSRRFGPYTLQGAIAAVHAEAVDAASTDWAQIAGLYELLMRVEPSPVVELNRAVALSMRDGPEAALPLVEALLARGELRDYALIHSVKADLHRRLGQPGPARESYERALALTRQEPERRFLQKRLAELADQRS